MGIQRSEVSQEWCCIFSNVAGVSKHGATFFCDFLRILTHGGQNCLEQVVFVTHFRGRCLLFDMYFSAEVQAVGNAREVELDRLLKRDLKGTISKENGLPTIVFQGVFGGVKLHVCTKNAL